MVIAKSAISDLANILMTPVSLFAPALHAGGSPARDFIHRVHGKVFERPNEWLKRV
jgi:hypothetical protein